MVLKSYAKINLSLSVNKKLSSGLHDIQSIFCRVDFFDTILIKEIKKSTRDKIIFKGPFSKYIKKNNNSIQKVLNIMRDHKLISGYFNVKIYKKIPVYAGLGGGTSNAATIFKYLLKKKIRNKTFEKIVKNIGSDLRLFFYNQGYLNNIKSATEFDKNHKLNFLLVYPYVKCSTREIYSKVKKFSKKVKFFRGSFVSKRNLINNLRNSNNDLQVIVEKKYPVIKRLLSDISEAQGCILSRISGSGSTCYGLFINKNSSKVALKKLRKKYPNFWFSIANTI